jgi:hypothetical protein
LRRNIFVVFTKSLATTLLAGLWASASQDAIPYVTYGAPESTRRQAEEKTSFRVTNKEGLLQLLLTARGCRKYCDWSDQTVPENPHRCRALGVQRYTCTYVLRVLVTTMGLSLTEALTSSFTHAGKHAPAAKEASQQRKSIRLCTVLMIGYLGMYLYYPKTSLNNEHITVHCGTVWAYGDSWKI